jgi:dihydroxy-acid dehydratase
MTMGTAATMMSAMEALGFTLPGASSIPAVDSRHAAMATMTGRRIVDMVWEDLTPSQIISAAAVDNAITTVLAMAGSTNAVVHLLAIAHRAGIPLKLERFDELARRTPVLANMRPAGKYLMEDFFYAGGLPALLKALGDLLDPSCLTVNGATLGENIAQAQIFNADVIHERESPLVKSDALVVLRGNLAPDGAVMKPPAAEAHLLKHKGPAVVFDSYDEMKKRMDDPELQADENSVFILRNAGPKGGPGMPEWGQLPVPKKLLQKGVRDVVRISDSRMSGTSYGACVLHVAPESFVGGPLALVKEGDIIELDVGERRLNMLVSDEELARRRAAWTPPKPQFARGYGQMFSMHIKQANEGCDFDFLEGTAPIPEPAIN